MSKAERVIRSQKEELKKVHNTKIRKGDTVYRLSYDGGIAEYIGIYGRKDGAIAYRFVSGFPAYSYYDKDSVLEHAHKIIQKL